MKEGPVDPTNRSGATEGKTQELEQKVKDLDQALLEMKNSYLRAMADLDNYKKRVIKERAEIILSTSERLLRELLEVKDHLEMAVQHSHGATDVKPLHEGILLTLKQMDQFLEKVGVTPIKSLGEPFSPAFHEALMEEESVEFQPRSVIKEFQKGYLFQGKLLRAARVVIAKDKKL
ncbi:MAG: nucleotide exchange factor GrpE [Deltaproteobacteria bacterium]|nr:nucleotide exchange factor GrpE [Deltaproteobacteria bacterium]